MIAQDVEFASIMGASFFFPSKLNTGIRYVSDDPDCNCGDFLTHGEAQAFFDAAGPGEPHRLDRNVDGVPCEELP
ncbi:hypothetical protein BSNK01_31140 [Bacillaceae bacterium]